MSKRKLAGIIVGCIIVVISIVAPAMPIIKVTNYSALLIYLRGLGASIEVEGETPYDFFDAKGRRVKVNTSHIEVFEYANAGAMESAASRVSPDGFRITTERWDVGVSWIYDPHFDKAGRIIVMYIGDNSYTISLLEYALGKQFAGM